MQGCVARMFIYALHPKLAAETENLSIGQGQRSAVNGLL